MLAPKGEGLYIALLQRSLVISTAATQIGHRHICRLRRTKKSRSHSEPVDVRTGPVGLCLRQARRGECAMQSPTQNNCMDLRIKFHRNRSCDGQSARVKGWRLVLYTSSRPSGLSRPVLATTAFSRLVVAVGTIWTPCQL